MSRPSLSSSEPKYDAFDADNQGKFMQAMNWYNYEKDKKDALAYAGAWVKKHWPADYKFWAKIDEDKFSRTFGWVARMSMNGTAFEDTVQKRMAAHFQELLTQAKSVKEEPVAVATAVTPKRSIQDAMAEKQAEFLGEAIDGEIDNFITNSFKPTGYNLYKYCQAHNVAKQYLAGVAPICNRLLAELDLIGTDAQVTEAWRHAGKRDIKALREFLQTLTEDADRYANFKKANRKPRVKKAKPAGEQVAKLKYLKQHEELKSVTAPSIVGAQQLWVYNIKNKKLGVYIAAGASGFSVKGTSLQGYDPDASVQRTLRKPEVVIPKMMAAGKVALRKILTDLTTTETKLNGRFNEDTLLLRVL
jgi:hypothetical protein